MANALKTYFEATQDTPTLLARRIGKPYSTVYRVLTARRAATPEIAIAISEGTKGVVTPAQIRAIAVEDATTS